DGRGHPARARGSRAGRAPGGRGARGGPVVLVGSRAAAPARRLRARARGRRARPRRAADDRSVKIQLDAARFVTHGDTRAQGYAHLDARYLDARRLAEHVNACPDLASWRSLVSRLNGCFALVTSRPGLQAAAVDRVRTIPLFFAVRGADAWLTDDAPWPRTVL